MKPIFTVAFVIFALTGCRDEAALRELESFKHENSRLKKSEAKLEAELKTLRSGAREAIAKDPGIADTPKYFQLYSMLTEQASDAQWLVTGLETMAAIRLEATKSPTVRETMKILRDATATFDTTNQRIAELLPGVLADPATHPERLVAMEKLKETIDRKAVAIHQLVEKLPPPN